MTKEVLDMTTNQCIIIREGENTLDIPRKNIGKFALKMKKNTYSLMCLVCLACV